MNSRLGSFLHGGRGWVLRKLGGHVPPARFASSVWIITASARSSVSKGVPDGNGAIAVGLWVGRVHIMGLHKVVGDVDQYFSL